MQIRALILLASWLLISCSAVAAEHVFRFNKPEAQSVILMGEFNGWKGQAMTKDERGIWSAKVSLGAGTFGYKFLVNGTDWLLDPENARHKSVDGVENSAVEITDAANPSPIATPRVATGASPTPSRPPANPAPVEKLEIAPGELLIREFPLSEKRRAQAASDGNPKLQHGRIGLSVPQEFDPQKPWPIAVICNTLGYSNIDSLRQFKDAANAAGWVVVAGDGVETAFDMVGENHVACAGGAFDYLQAAWPGVKDWPVASAGMSGGGKNGAFVAAALAREQHRVIGMLMMGCNEDMASVAYRRAATPVSFMRAGVFLSSGKADKIATPEQHEFVKGSLRGSGFFKVRLESFEGAHDIYQPHIGEALRWFMEEANRGAAAASPTPNSFDQFFKKKP